MFAISIRLECVLTTSAERYFLSLSLAGVTDFSWSRITVMLEAKITIYAVATWTLDLFLNVNLFSWGLHSRPWTTYTSQTYWVWTSVKICAITCYVWNVMTWHYSCWALETVTRGARLMRINYDSTFQVRGTWRLSWWKEFLENHLEIPPNCRSRFIC